jgi:hypothetical protein
MTQVKAVVLRRLPLPYTTTHYAGSQLLGRSAPKTSLPDRAFVESRLRMCAEASAQGRKPYEITFSIAGRFVTDRSVRDAIGQWTHHDLVGHTTTALNDDDRSIGGV